MLVVFASKLYYPPIRPCRRITPASPESAPEMPTDQGSSAELRICIPPPKPVSAPAKSIIIEGKPPARLQVSFVPKYRSGTEARAAAPSRKLLMASVFKLIAAVFAPMALVFAEIAVVLAPIRLALASISDAF